MLLEYKEMIQIMERSRIFTIATANTFRDIISHFMSEKYLWSGYIGAKYRKVRVTIKVEEI